MCNNMIMHILVKLGFGAMLMGATIFLLSSLWFTFYVGKIVGLITCCMGAILIIAGIITRAIAQDEDAITEIPEITTSTLETRPVLPVPKPSHTWIRQALLNQTGSQSSTIPLVPVCPTTPSYTYGWASAPPSNSHLDQPPPSYDEAMRESYRRTF